MAWGKIFGIGVAILLLSLAFHPIEARAERNTLMEKLAKLELERQKLQNKTSLTFVGSIFNMPFLIATFCKINAVYVLSGDTKIGFSIAGVKKFFSSSLFSYDFVDACWGGLGVVEAKGMVRSHTMVMIPSFMMNIGFIGNHIHIPAMLDIYHGYSMLTFAIGFGMKSVTFNALGFLIIGVIIGAVIAYLIQSSSTP